MKTSLEKNFIKSENMSDEKFYNSLIEELNKIIEEELSKNYEEINAEVIDDCCLALQSIYELQNGDGEEFTNITNINSIVKKYNLYQRKKTVVSVACAAVAVFAIGVTSFTLSSETVAEGNVFKAALGRFEELFKNEEPTKTVTTEPPESTKSETTEIQTTEEYISLHNSLPEVTEKQIKGISVILTPGSTGLYHSVEEINLKNTFVRVDYLNGENETINISQCTVTIGEPKMDGETKVTVSYNGFETYIYVTVLPEEKLNPKTLTSVYGTFENDYTIEEMRVFAVFSDGTEKEIPKSDCTITTEEFNDETENGVIVTVEYQGCSFQFFSETEEVL
ncbi:MAG: hypothetical protein IJN49_03005 [Clostridia bacterium]|nr:hypothetical protein [Clostridia bacterium]